MTRWVTYESGSDTAPEVGVIDGDQIAPTPSVARLVDLLHSGEGAAVAEQALSQSPRLPVSEVRLLPPIQAPPAVRDFMAFEQHAKAGFERMGYELPQVFYDRPVFYFTNPRALIGANDVVPVPPTCKRLDFELEIAAVIGTELTDAAADEAIDAIAGYTIYVDWSARDIQAEEMVVNLGPVKSKDTATTLGPYLVTPDELESAKSDNGFDLAMTVSVNGRVYGRDSLSNLMWSFGEMLSYASQGTTLSVGDVIGSGTCGNGCLLELQYKASEEEFPWLKAGDRVVVDVERLGRTDNVIGSTTDSASWPFGSSQKPAP